MPSVSLTPLAQHNARVSKSAFMSVFSATGRPCVGVQTAPDAFMTENTALLATDASSHTTMTATIVGSTRACTCRHVQR
jgi:hypothetical protein